MASLAAIGSTSVLPSLARPSVGNTFKGKSYTSSNQSQNFSRIVCSITNRTSDDHSDVSLGTFFQTKVFPGLSSVLIASSLVFGNISEPAIALENEYIRPVMAVVGEDIDRDTYLNMLQGIKSEESPGATQQVLTPEDRARKFKETLELKKKEAAARAEEEKRRIEEAQKAEAEAKAKKEAEQEALKIKAQEDARAKKESKSIQKQSVTATTQQSQSRGFMPLFLSQFSLFLAFAGIISAVFLVPDSKYKEIEQKKDEILEKVLPVVNETVEKLRPVAKEALSATEKFIVEAKPVVENAIETSKPVVAKAIEQAKPLIEKGQQKAAELIQQAKESSSK